MDQARIDIGDIYFYPRIGPVRMTARAVESIHGKQQIITRWQSMSPLAFDQATFAIPEDRLGDVLRPIVSEKEIAEIFVSLGDPTVTAVSKTHSQRYRQQYEKINDGNSLDLAELVRDLYRRRVYKTPAPLSDSEKRNLDRAMRSLSQEVSIALGITESVAEKRMIEALMKPLEEIRRKKVA